MGNYLTHADGLSKDFSTHDQPGRRLLIRVLEERAQFGENKVFAELPLTDNPKDGFRPISYQALLRAIDRCSHLLDEKLGEAHKSQGTVGWISYPSDLRYLILGLACMKTGHRCYFPSPRNDINSHLSLLEKCQCESFLQPRTEVMPIVAALREKRSMKFLEMPDLEDLLAETAEPAPMYPFTKSFEEARHDPCMVLHTSGSTGIPKIVTLKQGWFSVLDAYQNLTGLGAAPAQLSRFADLRLFMPFPYFHTASVGLCLALPVFFDMTLICPPPKPLTADLADQYHRYADCDVSMLPMSVLQDIVSDRSAYQNLEKVKYLGYGGSKIGSSLGRSLAEKTYLFSFIGLTEVSKMIKSPGAGNVNRYRLVHYLSRSPLTRTGNTCTSSPPLVVNLDKDQRPNMRWYWYVGLRLSTCKLSLLRFLRLPNGAQKIFIQNTPLNLTTGSTKVAQTTLSSSVTAKS